jgi:hypothetical protein
VVTDEEPIVIAEEPVPQIEDDFADTVLEIIEPLHPLSCTPTSRATTSSDWPPAPPVPASLADAFAVGTQPPRRRAQVYAVVRRPTTSGDSK